jgi:hypothetical protein
VSFLDEVYAAGAPRETKADVVEYYQSKYTGRGQAGWKQSLIRDLLPYTPQTGKNPAKNLARRFDPSRLNNPEPRNVEQYQELGATLPPKAPEGGYHIHGTYQVKYSDDCEERTFDEKITGDNAKELAKMAEEDMLQALANYRQTEDFDTQGPSICGEPELEVEAIEE